MKRFLSVDWDFFIGATAEQRYMMFPDGGNESLNTTLRDYIWDTHYRDPNLAKLGVSSHFPAMRRICREFRGDCFIADSHRFAYDFIMEHTKPDEEFEVYNIDFHHDLYNYRTGEERVNCGNWGTILHEDRPNMKFYWVKRNDSETMTIGDVEVDAEMISFKDFLARFSNAVSAHFDYLYLCRSAMWSPPHLDPKFVQLVKPLMQNCFTQYEQGIDTPRPYEIPTDFSEYLATAKLNHKHEKEIWGET